MWLAAPLFYSDATLIRDMEMIPSDERPPAFIRVTPGVEDWTFEVGNHVMVEVESDDIVKLKKLLRDELAEPTYEWQGSVIACYCDGYQLSVYIDGTYIYLTVEQAKRLLSDLDRAKVVMEEEYA